MHRVADHGTGMCYHARRKFRNGQDHVCGHADHRDLRCRGLEILLIRLCVYLFVCHTIIFLQYSG